MVYTSLYTLVYIALRSIIALLRCYFWEALGNLFLCYSRVVDGRGDKPRCGAFRHLVNNMGFTWAGHGLRVNISDLC